MTHLSIFSSLRSPAKQENSLDLLKSQCLIGLLCYGSCLVMHGKGDLLTTTNICTQGTIFFIYSLILLVFNTGLWNISSKLRHHHYGVADPHQTPGKSHVHPQIWWKIFLCMTGAETQNHTYVFLSQGIIIISQKQLNNQNSCTQVKNRIKAGAKILPTDQLNIELSNHKSELFHLPQLTYQYRRKTPNQPYWARKQQYRECYGGRIILK